MIPGFVYQGTPSRVVFGTGTLARLPEEVDRLGLRRVLVLSTAQQEREARDLAARLGNRAAGVCAGAVMHTPVEVTARAVEHATGLGADGLVSLGGGSSIGLGKAIVLRTGLPHIAVPTTYAGSEMTPILGQTRDGIKTTQREPGLLPGTVLYDVDLTLSLPVPMSVTSGMNAIAHAVEALYARDGNPIVTMMAEEGIAALLRALPAIVGNPTDAAARSDALYGAWLCGICLGSAGMALHHKLCHVLGGTFDLPHAETHTVVLPHVVAYNARAAASAIGRVGALMGTADAGTAMQALARRLGAPTALRDLGMPEAGIERAAELAVRSPYWNPRAVDRDSLHALLARAWAGAPPMID
ncbi:maleylacetate reductase [Azospirillum sp. RWY-5-1]|uniref:Maleylacetate reductase n=1 Tax=Azospirillum oleiclasticum TaxID=2735135 RepID=A0ABX2TFT8_9PROT|nr:maleylacetate reductase [Azospirillum oleiclasticum]NYZ14444.1 maleylacetate reductase [Azospirillum oleiclasticum]NYZ23204.1 maleylacetate reductase [Azospirillum oleiclasticum]